MAPLCLETLAEFLTLPSPDNIFIPHRQEDLVRTTLITFFLLTILLRQHPNPGILKGFFSHADFRYIFVLGHSLDHNWCPVLCVLLVATLLLVQLPVINF